LLAFQHVSSIRRGYSDTETQYPGVFFFVLNRKRMWPWQKSPWIRVPSTQANTYQRKMWLVLQNWFGSYIERII